MATGKVTPAGRELDMWVIYKHPKDYPDKFVARRWDATSATDDVVVADNIGVLQAQMIEAGRIKFMRAEDDDPVIMEVWL